MEIVKLNRSLDDRKYKNGTDALEKAMAQVGPLLSEPPHIRVGHSTLIPEIVGSVTRPKAWSLGSLSINSSPSSLKSSLFIHPAFL